MNFRTALVAATLLALPAAAMAQPVDGTYIGAGVGLNDLASEKVKSPAGNPSFKASTGFIGLARVGYGLGNGLRVEGELSDRMTSQKGSGDKATNSTIGLFLNGLYDFDAGSESVYPYAGLGVGYAMQDMSSGKLADGTTFSGSKGGIAGQLILGAAFPIESTPGLSATAEYRFMDTLAGSTFGKAKLGPELNHSLLIGLRYALGVTPPAPMAPAPAPVPVKAVEPEVQPARSYIVYFDWDKSDLNAADKKIILEAAQASQKVQVTQIAVAGHADKSGSPAYNKKLSQKRADVVAAELVADGVPADKISAASFGDSAPIGETGPDGRSPQSRRVLIEFK